MNTLKKLEEWYDSHCDGDWEHGERIRVTTLDNPGWGIDINLDDTELKAKPFQPIEVERDERDWLHCHIKNGRFLIRGGPRNLEEGILIFVDWTTS
jgi:hypothetical protein